MYCINIGFKAGKTKNITLIFVLVWGILAPNMAFCQANPVFGLTIVCDTPNTFCQNLQYKRVFQDSLSRLSFLNTFINNLKDNGYLEANFDLLSLHKNQLQARLHSGSLYQWHELKIENNANTVLVTNADRQRLKTINKEPISIKKYNYLVKNILQTYENNGYPFAKISLDTINHQHHIETQSNAIEAQITITKQELITIDSLCLFGTYRIGVAFLEDYLGIRVGDVYSQQKINAINRKLRDLKYLEITQAPKIMFYKQRAVIYIFLKDLPINQADGIVGVFPNNRLNNKLLITGDVNLLIYNSLKRGEHFSVNWKRLNVGVSDLKISANYPYIFSLPLGIDADFER